MERDSLTVLSTRLRPPRSAYLHIPFCHRRCFYCDFPVVPLGDRADGDRSGSIEAYMELICGEILTSTHGPPLSTVYIGGGTPSMLTSEQIGRLLKTLEQQFGFAQAAEVSLELDPASFNAVKLAGFLQAGVNRVSLGCQSFDDALLAALGRRHQRHDIYRSVKWLQQAQARGEIASWSLDLIQGLPLQAGQKQLQLGHTALMHWSQQLDQAINLEPPHLSIYDLIVEPGTVFAWRQDRGELLLPTEDLGADLMEMTWRRLTEAGYGHYEISNYALPGHTSRHNRVYWNGAGWWGFGLGATSAPYGLRLSRPRTRAAYADWLAQAKGEEQISARSGMPVDEILMVGLRQREGVNMEKLAAEHDLSIGQIHALRQRLKPFERQGTLLVQGPRWKLSDPAGLAISNSIIREILDWWEQTCQSQPAHAAA